MEASPAALPATGGNTTITVEGSDLSSLLVAADGPSGSQVAPVVAQGSGAKQTAELTFPPNTTTAAQAYTVRVSTDNGQTWSQVTATVTVATPVTGLTVSPAALPSTGGDTTVTVAGANLTDGMLVAVFDGQTPLPYPWASTTTQGSGTAQTAALTFPPNVTTAAEVYTVRVSSDSGQTWSQLAPTVTVAPAPQITGLTVSPAALPAAGGDTTVTVAGTDLTDGMLVAVFDGQTRLNDPWASTTTQGSGTAQTAALTFPPNVTTAAEAYTVRVSTDNGQTWSQVTATVTVATPVTGLTVSPADLPAAGGDTTVTVAGANLTDGMLVAVFDGQTRLNDPWASTTTQGDGTAQTAALTFPPNVTTAAEVYTVRVSTDNGQTWSQHTATVTVAPAPQITGLTVSPAALPAAGGDTTVTVVGTDLTDGMLVAVFDGQTRLPYPWASTTTQGSGTAQTAAVTFPPNVTAAAEAYTVRVSTDNGQTWSQPTTTITLAAAEGPSTAVADGTAARGLAQTGGVLSAISFVVTAVLLLLGAALLAVARLRRNRQV